jgi:mannose-6-phosphate isomerase-like protein (cupin superfamily)
MPTDDDKRFDTHTKAVGYDYLAPDGSEIQELVNVSGAGLAHCRLPVGGQSIAVRHQTVEEIWFFLSGIGEVWRKLGDIAEVTPVHTGVSLTIPIGTNFQFRNNGQEALDFVIVTIPRWPGTGEAVQVEGKWKTP